MIVEMALANLKVYFDSIGDYKNTANEEETQKHRITIAIINNKIP